MKFQNSDFWRQNKVKDIENFKVHETFISNWYKKIDTWLFLEYYWIMDMLEYVWSII